jgi:hypothetical protein
MTGFKSKKKAAQGKLTQPEQDATMQSLKDLARLVCDEVGKAAFAQPAQEPVACKTLCELCIKRGYNFCANAVKTTPIPNPPAAAQPEQEPVCPECKAGVLYECVACSSNNYPPQPAQEPVGKFAKFTDGIWREVTDGSPGVSLYTAPPQQVIQSYSEKHNLERPWVDLTSKQLNEIFEVAMTGEGAVNLALEKIKELNHD